MGETVLIDPVTFAMLGTLVFSALCGLVYMRPRLVTHHRKSVLTLVGLVSLACAMQLLSWDPPYISIDLDPSSESLISAPSLSVGRRAPMRPTTSLPTRTSRY